MAKKLSAEEKMAIVLEGLRGNKTITEVCGEHGISQAQYYRWRDKFFEGAKTALESYGNETYLKNCATHFLELCVNFISLPPFRTSTSLSASTCIC